MDQVVKEEKKIERQVYTIIDQSRVVSFSDAVFAFAATLLVLKIDLPQIVKSQLQTQFLPAVSMLWPQYYANIISFLVIGYYWLNHHALFGLMKRVDITVVWINITFLIFLSFLPFPVDLFGDFPFTPIVVVLYSASLAIVGFLLSTIWWYASHNYRLIDKELGKLQIRYYLARTLIAPVVFTLSIPLVYIDPLVAQFSWIFVLVGIVVVNKVFKVRRLSKIEELSI